MASQTAQNIPLQQLGPSYSIPLAFEQNFDFPGSLEWFNNNYHIPIIFSVLIYLPVIFIGQIIMRNREPLNIKTSMMLWNAGLATFSILGFIRVFPELLYTLNKFGFQHTICNNSWTQIKETRFWIYLFVLSKIPELGDTFFLVMRKQKLIFLHVYHHASVVIFSWFVYADQMAAARWFSAVNLGIHSVMYSYYVLKAMPHLVKVPKWVSMFITTSQSIQMVVGAYVVISGYRTKLMGGECATSTKLSISGTFIYISYLILFSKFFYDSYCATSPRKESKNRISDKKKA